MLTATFWLSLALLGYAYAGYPLLLRLLLAGRRLLGREPGAGAIAGEPAGDWPRLSLVLVARDEAERVEARLDNLAACAYPGWRELVMVCDNCSDDTAARARAWTGDLEAKVIEQRSGLGKAAGLNRAVAEARGEILVFADARQRFHPDALVRLAAPFARPEVGAVSGSLEIAASGGGAGAGLDAYWKAERRLRRMESDWDSVIGCTGAIYALRRDLCQPLPEDTILDDVVAPMRVVAGGKRVLFESEAVAWDPQDLSPGRESRRKVRTLAGNYQMLVRYPEWLLPWRNRTWWQLASHKYLRLAGPWLLALCLGSSAALARESGFFRAVLFGQLACYALAAAGMLLPRSRAPWLFVPAAFVFLQWQSLRALLHYLRLRRSPRAGVWS